MSIPALNFRRASWLPSALFLLALTGLMFRVVWPVGQTLLAQDYSYSLMAQYKAELPGGFLSGFWRGMPLLGRIGFTPPTVSHLLLWLLPVEIFFDWIYGLHLLGASLFLYGFLRLRQLDPLPALFGSVCAFWLGSNLTLAAPGHLEKFGVLLFAAASLYGIEKLFQRPGWRGALFLGGSAGMMFLHQGDVALFFALPLAGWGLFRLLSRPRPEALRLLPRLILALIPFLMIGLHTYRFSMAAHVDGVAVLESDDTGPRWDFATQWSWPPEESIDFIVQGFTGWSSANPIVPYHGRMGRSPEWSPDTPEGFVNFKLESQYLGLLPILLALFAMAARPRSGEIRYWAAALLLSLLLSFGKYFPLYSLFYRLPLVDTIRNPNKFLQVFQVLLGILAAHGLQAFGSAPAPLRKGFTRILLAAGGLLLLGGLMLSPHDPWLTLRFAGTPWADHAMLILSTRRRGLLLAGALALLAGALFSGSRKRPQLLLGLLLIAGADALLLGRHYLHAFPTRFLTENALADHLEARLGPDRVAVLDENSYAYFVAHLFPARHIAHVNVLSVARLPADLDAYFSEHGYNTPRMWKDFGVRYVLMPGSAWTHVAERPDLRAAFSFDIAHHVLGELHLLENPNGAHVLVEFTDFPGRFQLSRGRIHHTKTERNGFRLEVEIPDGGATLRLADRFDPRIIARHLSGSRDLTVRPAEPFFTEIDLPPGEYDLRIGFTDSNPLRLLQLLGVALWLLSLFPSKQHPIPRFPHDQPQN